MPANDPQEEAFYYHVHSNDKKCHASARILIQFADDNWVMKKECYD